MALPKARRGVTKKTFTISQQATWKSNGLQTAFCGSEQPCQISDLPRTKYQRFLRSLFAAQGLPPRLLRFQSGLKLRRCYSRCGPLLPRHLRPVCAIDLDEVLFAGPARQPEQTQAFGRLRQLPERWESRRAMLGGLCVKTGRIRWTWMSERGCRVNVLPLPWLGARAVKAGVDFLTIASRYMRLRRAGPH